MSAGHRSTSPWNKKRASFVNVPIKETESRRIEVAGWPERIDERGALIINGAPTETKPDVMVFATGYKTSFPFLSNEYAGLSHANVRGIYKDSDVSVGYIGFVRPSLGKTVLLLSFVQS